MSHGRISLDYQPLHALYVLIKQVKLLKKRIFKASFFSRKHFERESLSEVQFVVNSCRIVSQSNYLNSSNKECDWLILACFIREQYTADATFTALEKKVWFENSANIGFFIKKQITKRRLCSVLL